MKEYIVKNLTIFCKDFELTDAIKAYIEEKMSTLTKFFNEAELETIHYSFRLGKTAQSHHNGKIFYAEVSMHTPEKNYGCRIEAENTYEAIDLIKDELVGNVTQHKDKARTLYIKGAQKFKQEIHELE
jgi:ribosomal subunit interface protein